MTAPLTLPDAATLFEVTERTWPAASLAHVGAWTIREGQGGGQRVSAATENWPVTEADLPAAEAAMRALGQAPLFQVRAGEEALDEMLAHHGYERHDPVNLWAIPLGELTQVKAPPVSGFAVWPPLEIMRDLWAAGGIGEGRLAVMERAEGPKTGLLGRTADNPAGVGFVGIHDGVAMVHALYVAPDYRRMGTARNLITVAAHWAEARGARVLALLVTQGNHAANPLYTALGMRLVGHYHYRRKPPSTQG